MMISSIHRSAFARLTLFKIHIVVNIRHFHLGIRRSERSFQQLPNRNNLLLHSRRQHTSSIVKDDTHHNYQVFDQSNLKQVKSKPLSRIPLSDRFSLSYTCSICNQRNENRSINRQAYTAGVVLCRCEKCQKLHLFADHLKWFSDERITIETIMKEKGHQIKRGFMDENGNVTEILTEIQHDDQSSVNDFNKSIPLTTLAEMIESEQGTIEFTETLIDDSQTTK